MEEEINKYLINDLTNIVMEYVTDKCKFCNVTLFTWGPCIKCKWDNWHFIKYTEMSCTAKLRRRKHYLDRMREEFKYKYKENSFKFEDASLCLKWKFDTHKSLFHRNLGGDALIREARNIECQINPDYKAYRTRTDEYERKHKEEWDKLQEEASRNRKVTDELFKKWDERKKNLRSVF